MPSYSRHPNDPLLRAAGMVLLAIGALLIRHLLRTATAGASPVALLWAALAYASLSGGAILTALGAHVFDRVRVSTRWRRVPRAHAVPHRPAGTTRSSAAARSASPNGLSSRVSPSIGSAAPV